ncbi:DUF4153 domain-containing protein [Nocardia sp. NPDC058658]|uniref:DUF4153 domain-containing protein n=1 Tax=Nocardia sp. NPDC058658 TaxID=3346580 RepID=UPI00366448F2
MSDKPIPEAPKPAPSATETPKPAAETSQTGGGETSSGTQATAVLTPAPDTTTPVAPATDGTVPVTTLLAERRTSGAVQPGTPGWTAAAWPNAAAVAKSGSSVRSTPLPSMPPPLPPVPKRWQCVARPPGVLPAAALAGIVGATVIPVDRPGIGWLIAGTAITGALVAVDYRARYRGGSEADEVAAATEDSDSRRTADPVPGDNAAPTSETVMSRSADTESERAAVHDDPTDNGAESVRSVANTPDSSAGDIGAVKAPAEGEPAGAATLSQTDSAETGSATAPAPNSAVSANKAVSTDEAMSANKTVAPNESVPHSVSIGDRVWWAAAALVLLGVGTVRAAGWLFVLCVIAACVAGSLAVLGRRSVRGIAHDMFAVPLASFGAVPWAFSGLRESRSVGSSTVRRYGVSIAATAALLVVFVPLLGGADATFAKMLNGLVPKVDGPAAWQWIFLFVVVTVGVLGALYLLAGPPARAADSVRPVRLWSRSEWMLPVGALTVLFAVFVGAQFVALFGGDDYVQRTAGLTYAEYARSGFWQLSAVSILTLAVIVAVLHWSKQETAADRLSLRVLLSAVSVLALVIVGSALGRMWTYQQAYGFTVLRLLVTMCELWVGLVYILVLAAVARLRWTWVPRAAIGTALATLIALAAINPEHLVAERNIDRWSTSKRLDADYLGTLSPDILPALDGLQDPFLRMQIKDAVLRDLDDDHWWSWNWSRSSAR